MIELPIMAFTKVIMAPHPRPPPLGGDQRMLATLEILNDSRSTRYRP
jgi:hypothetical protein